MSKVKQIFKTIFMVEIARGLALTLKTMLTPTVTRQYPTFKRKPFPGSRGLHAMRRDESGAREKCIGCGLCEAVCPSKAIKVVTSEGPEHAKLVNSYELDLLRCVFCGFCVDACPVSAILMTPEFELACYSRKDAFYTKDRLIEVGDRYMGGKRVPAAEATPQSEGPSSEPEPSPAPKEPVLRAGGQYAGGKAVKE